MQVKCTFFPWSVVPSLSKLVTVVFIALALYCASVCDGGKVGVGEGVTVGADVGIEVGTEVVYPTGLFEDVDEVDTEGFGEPGLLPKA